MKKTILTLLLTIAATTMQAQQLTVRRDRAGHMQKTYPDSLLTPQMHAFRATILSGASSRWQIASVPLYALGTVTLIADIYDNRKLSNLLGFSCLVGALGCTTVSIALKKDARAELRLSAAGPALALTF